MARLDDHPTVMALRDRPPAPRSDRLDAAGLRARCLALGADDVGFVSIDHPDLANEVEHVRRALPTVRTLVSVVCRLHADNVRSPARSISNLEFRRRGEAVNQVTRAIAVDLAARGVRAVTPSAAYPMELDGFPDVRMWLVAHKTVAVAAGVGRMGRNRLLLHPRFGAFVLLGTVLLDVDVTPTAAPLPFDPCVECQLCAAVCPVGAVPAGPRDPTATGSAAFNFVSCLTHCYRENLGGFIDWSERVAAGGDRSALRSRIPDPEAASLWQSLVAGPSFRTSYCMAVCPAGEEVLGPWLADRKRWLDEVVRPFQESPERVFVTPGSDAEAHVTKRFPHKQVRRVGNGVRPQTIAGFVRAMPLVFQPNASDGLDATFHLTFTGAEARSVTVTIREKAIRVVEGLEGKADLAVTADATTWLGILSKERNVPWALVTRRLVVKGSPALLQRFSTCFG